jgi:hypothetical protein
MPLCSLILATSALNPEPLASQREARESENQSIELLYDGGKLQALVRIRTDETQGQQGATHNTRHDSRRTNSR